ncbi:ABC-type multidrug transport system, ATPase component [Streptomyces zhaozhouensis]|uniref:ABC-type multidrug transport system, ATPase component n=1 Tax=Streptomyces zhaozhouensis TaxID=1300267 RepID=A0A286DZV1_9ACTN|nr:ATP-binding cassette domain-containing protein [Streptomyces zhaozhouensis]SOD64191.1 ABC-type multidrug transport system, ATPase component [Streptomyces zhaozhouensis]
MIQTIGLTSASRRGRPPAVDDLTFEAGAGEVTVLLGPPGAGKSAALRLMLQLAPGRGVALFRGRPLSRMPQPQREIGTLLGDVPGHPRRSAVGHLRMLAAAAGVPAGRADEVLEVVGLTGLAGQRLGRFSLGMDRRLGLAAALLGDPHTLVLDEPESGLSPRERGWAQGLLRGYAEQGGTVLMTATDAMEAARVADRVVSLDGGRLVADQRIADFRRTRLRPRVAVRSPHAERLATVLQHRLRTTAAAEVVREAGNRLSVYGSDLATVGEIAHQHRIVVHQLADEIGDAGDRAPAGPLRRADGRPADGDGARRAQEPTTTVVLVPRTAESTPALAGEAGAAGEATPEGKGEVALAEGAESGVATSRVGASAPTAAPASVVIGAGAPTSHAATGTAVDTLPPPARERLTTAPGARDGAAPSEAGAPARGGRVTVRPGLPPALPALPPPGPSWPLRYELRRWSGTGTAWWLMALALLAGLAVAVGLAWTGSSSPERLLSGWAEPLPLPPVAAAAGVLGALAFGQEFRFPALAPSSRQVPRRLSLLGGKLAVCGAAALLLCGAAIAVNSAALTLLLGTRSPTPESWPSAFESVAALSVGCAWAGLLAAGVFRSAVVGVGAVAAVPLALAPALRMVPDSPLGRELDGLPERLTALTTLPFASLLDRWLTASVRLAAQPVGWALALALAVLLCGYALAGLRRVRR